MSIRTMQPTWQGVKVPSPFKFVIGLCNYAYGRWTLIFRGVNLVLGKLGVLLFHQQHKPGLTTSSKCLCLGLVLPVQYLHLSFVDWKIRRCLTPPILYVRDSWINDVADPGATLNDDATHVVLSAGRVLLLVVICCVPLLLLIYLESSTLPRKQKIIIRLL